MRSVLLLALLAALVLSPRAEKHVREGHCPGGKRTKGKSVFIDCSDLAGLLEKAEAVKPARQKNGRDKRVVSGKEPVGTDGRSKKPVKSYVVIAEPEGAVVTMYPGR
jgi:hypothetical protein